MSINTGAVCRYCKKWHSHMVEDKRFFDGLHWRWKYICVNCKEKRRRKEKDGRKG